MTERAITVLLGTCNRCALVQRAIQSVVEQEGIAPQLIVIDAGSSDGTLDALRSRSDFCLLEDGKKLGQATSLNRAATGIQTPYLCWISDDNIVHPSALASAVGILEKDSSIGMVSLKVRDVAGSRTQKPYIGAISSAGFINCNQGVIRTDLFRQIGGFDEGFADYMIDTDLTAKVLIAGKSVVFSKKVAIEHHRDHEPDSWISKEARKERLDSRRILFEQRYSGLIRWVDKLQTRRFLEQRLRKVSLQKKLQSLLERIGFGGYKWNERDWHNLSFASSVSIHDAIRHLISPYYLRQSLPEEARSFLVGNSHPFADSARPRREMHVKRWELASQIECARQRGDTKAIKDLRDAVDEIDFSLAK